MMNEKTKPNSAVLSYDSQSWWLTVVVSSALVIFIIGTFSPHLVGIPHNASLQLQVSLTALSFLVLLFSLYILQGTKKMSHLKEELSRATEQMRQIQFKLTEEVTRRSVELERTKNLLDQAVAERDRVSERIFHMSHFDSLTDLPNRTLLMDRLQHSMSRLPWHNRFLAVVSIDLDHFKRINDTLGHAMGDLLLRGVAGRLSAMVRDGDTVARPGGDEFLIVLADIAKIEDVRRIAHQILKQFLSPFVLEGQEVVITPSLGISVYPDDGDHPETLIQNADISMFRAKEMGRNCFRLFSPAIEKRTAEYLSVETNLRKAIERGQLVLNYQPQVSLRTGGIIAMEALVRWNHPERGMISPSQFIPIAEETGLIIPLGEWVLKTACATNKAWQEAGLPMIRMAVNLSARQFQHDDLLAVINQILDETRLNPQTLELELTESIMQNSELAEKTLREINGMGIQISIDDFGTGFSSLNYLKRFPIQRLKIDQSFVRGIPNEADDCVIVQAVINLAHNMNRKVVAEAVETEEQLNHLLSVNCDEIQGYYFSRPLPENEARHLLQSGKKLDIPPAQSPGS